MNTRHTLISLAAAALLLTACSAEVSIPADSTPVDEQADLYPDYRDIVIPPNIAPLNVRVTSEGEDFVADIKGPSGQLTAAAGKDGKFFLDPTEWKSLLDNNKGRELDVTLYARRGKQWVKHPSYKIKVAEEPIDRYLCYRLIEPGYELYRQLGLYQRDLATFEQRPIYENNRTYDSIDNHCVNCHNFQNYNSRRMLFHVRGGHGGTIFVEDGKAKKMNMKSDSVLSSTVYPTWHPQRNWVVFSTNQTGQAFHLKDKQKIEVIDYGSDLVFYDADAHTLTNIFKTTEELETFPCWTPDGKKIFYCSAHVPWFENKDTKQRMDMVTAIYDSIRYNLMSVSFDEQTRTFGRPVVEVDCAAMGKSASVPRVSPDGRYVLFTLADFGQFHIWHKSSDLYVKDLQTGEIRPLTAANSDNVDSYHSWSSNGRWLVVASRRDDGSYTRVYIAYFDREGQVHKAFLLPQEDPEQNILLMKSYNVPELTGTPVSITPEELQRVIYNDEATEKVSYKP